MSRQKQLDASTAAAAVEDDVWIDEDEEVWEWNEEEKYWWWMIVEGEWEEEEEDCQIECREGMEYPIGTGEEWRADRMDWRVQ